MRKDRRSVEARKQFIKDAFKEAVREFLDEKIKQFGTLSLYTLAAAIITALLYFLLSINGWQHIPTVSSGGDILK